MNIDAFFDQLEQQQAPNPFGGLIDAIEAQEQEQQEEVADSDENVGNFPPPMGGMRSRTTSPREGRGDIDDPRYQQYLPERGINERTRDGRFHIVGNKLVFVPTGLRTPRR